MDVPLSIFPIPPRDVHAFTFDVANRLYESLPLKPVGMLQKYKGYSWYENLPRYENFALMVDSAVINERNREELEMLTLANTIQLSFELVKGPHNTQFLWELPFAGFNNCDNSMPQLFAARSSDWVKNGPSAGPFDLLSAAAHLAYSYDDDAGSDSSETQEANFDNWVGASIANVLGGSLGTARFEMRKALESWKLTNALNDAAVTEVRLARDEEGYWRFALGSAQQDAA